MTGRRLRLVLLPVVLSLPLLLSGCGGDPEFSSLVASIDHGGQFHRQHIPMLGMAGFFVGMAHPAGVKSIRIAIFEPDKNGVLDPEALAPPQHLLTRAFQGHDWQPIVRTRSRRDHEWTVIYARESTHDLELLVCTVEPGEGVVVQLKLSPERLIEFMDEHQHGDKDGGKDGVI
ncbi:MAG: hypothetical protein ACYC6M_00030 [Terriglobales bacterium]